jgi:hypothetical protein
MEDREGCKGHEEMGVGLHQISKQALFLPLITETPTALRDLGVKIISRITARPAVTPYLETILL